MTRPAPVIEATVAAVCSALAAGAAVYSLTRWVAERVRS